ncbi:hypothetical protein TNCV_3243261 [Trichonephila clavipes]|nr:hypothetical protein TNCV_3243261 [Trichonephila clavipes]
MFVVIHFSRYGYVHPVTACKTGTHLRRLFDAPHVSSFVVRRSPQNVSVFHQSIAIDVVPIPALKDKMFCAVALNKTNQTPPPPQWSTSMMLEGCTWLIVLSLCKHVENKCLDLISTQ